ncbi:MAG: PaaI family thioesterase [Rhodobacteraceae bacterium]|nr:PaaI family thioesterase [Paracoccaceae bacterium]
MEYASGLSELLPIEQLLEMSGLTFMQRMLAGQIPQPPISQTMGFQLHAVSEGMAEFRGAPSFHMTNPMGTVHGGWYGALLDSAMACAVMTRVPKGSLYTTLEYKINMIRPIPLDMEVTCLGTADHVGRSTAVAHGDIRGLDDDRLYATGSTTCIVMKIAHE